MYKYKNISQSQQTLATGGVVESGAIIDSEVEINNPNFEIVKDDRKIGIDPVTKNKKGHNL